MEGDGRLSCSAPACYGSSLGSNPDISQKYKMCDISKGVANTSYSPPKTKEQQSCVWGWGVLIFSLDILLGCGLGGGKKGSSNNRKYRELLF
jgi:hypothetical protein